MALGLAGALASCALPDTRSAVEVARAPRVPDTVAMGYEFGRLLGTDPAASEEARARLSNATGAARTAVLEEARRLEGERDPRYLAVLDAHGALPELPLETSLDYALWTLDRGGSVARMKAQARMIAVAEQDPTILERRMAAGGPAADAMALALGSAGRVTSVPVLLERYLAARSVPDREIAAEALGRIVGPARRPRASGTPEELRTDAERIRAWWSLQQTPSSVPMAPPTPTSRSVLDG